MSQASPAKTCAALVSYPKQAEFDRTLPKNKIYEHSGANTLNRPGFRGGSFT